MNNEKLKFSLLKKECDLMNRAGAALERSWLECQKIDGNAISSIEAHRTL